ncbi:MAG: hypothetical protein ABSE45_14870 [Candidatus Acidiferrales bacterium]|jgi:hypothetical protein
MNATAKPKIFLVISSTTAWAPDLAGAAIAEDGTMLAAHISSTAEWLRADLSRKEDIYGRRYPAGYELVWIGDPEASANEDFRRALEAAAGRRSRR